MKRIVTVIFLVSGIFSYSQNNGLESGTGTMGNITIGKPMYINFNKANELIGTEYLNEEFKSAKITAKDDKTATVDVRFNTYVQEFEIKQNNEVLALNRNIVKRLELEEGIFKPLKDENSKFIFAQVLVEGNLNLYKKYKAVIIEGKIKEGIQTETPKDKIAIKEYYLINKSDSETYSLLKLNKKSVLEVLNNNKKVIAFVKKNKLSYKKEDDIIKIFDFFNKQ